MIKKGLFFVAISLSAIGLTACSVTGRGYTECDDDGNCVYGGEVIITNESDRGLIYGSDLLVDFDGSNVAPPNAGMFVVRVINSSTGAVSVTLAPWTLVNGDAVLSNPSAFDTWLQGLPSGFDTIQFEESGMQVETVTGTNTLSVEFFHGTTSLGSAGETWTVNTGCGGIFQPPC